MLDHVGDISNPHCVYIPGSALSIQSAINQHSTLSRSFKMRYITAVVLFTIGATVQALPVPVPKLILHLDEPGSHELDQLLGALTADGLHDTSLATLVESKFKVDSCRSNTDLGDLNADWNRFRPTETQEKRCDFQASLGWRHQGGSRPR
jgi:hypothetical protein